MVKTITSYAIAIFAAIVSFLLAMNLRVLVLMVSRAVAMSQNRIPWGLSFINAASVIILMAGWLFYIFYTQHYFEKKCGFTKEAYINASLKFVLPVIVVYTATEAFLRVFAL